MTEYVCSLVVDIQTLWNSKLVGTHIESFYMIWKLMGRAIDLLGLTLLGKNKQYFKITTCTYVCFPFLQASLLMFHWCQVLMTCLTLISLNQKRMIFVFQTFPPRTSATSLEKACPLWGSPSQDMSQTMETGRESAPTIISENSLFHQRKHVWQDGWFVVWLNQDFFYIGPGGGGSCPLHG